MVIDDGPLPPREENPQLQLEDRLASPLDRAASWVADFVLISPVATLIMAPFRRFASEAQLQGADDHWLIFTGLGFGALGLLVIAYQAVFLVKWRATPGKRLFGLSVESLWQDEGEPMRAQAAFLRSFAWCVEACLLGFPWIAVLGNERRRPFHDRLADTIVLSKRRSRVGPPGFSEMSLASGLVSAFFTSLLIVVTFKVGQMRLSPSEAATAGVDGGAVCDLVDHAEKSWVEGLGETKPSRMSIALALYEGEAIDEECLKQEADASLWKSDEKDLAYLARGLAEHQDAELSQSYLDRACTGAEETDACRALAFLNDADVSDDPVEAKSARAAHDNEMDSLIASLSAKSGPFLKILAIRELTSRREDARALAMIDAFPPQKDLSFFLSSERMKALWALGRRNEARTSMMAAVGGYDGDQRVAITRWFCQNETGEDGCSASARASCDLLAASVEHDHVLLGDPEVTISYVRGEQCASRLTEEKLADLKNDMPDLNSQNYIEALAALTKGDADVGRRLLSEITSKGEEAGPYYSEAQARLVDLASSTQEVSALREDWADGDQTSDGWAFVGRHLMAKYNQLKAYDQTIEVGFKLGETDPLDQSAARSFIVAAYRSGQTKMALGYLQTYFGPGTETASVDRLPASSDEFSEVVREMREDFSVTSRARRTPSALPTRLPAKKRHAR